MTNDNDMIRRGDALKAMADYHWNRYASRDEGGTLSSPAVFTSHTWQAVQDILAALPAVTVGADADAYCWPCHYAGSCAKHPPAPDAAAIREAAQSLLDLHDGFLAGEDVDEAAADRLAVASCFGAEAFMACPVAGAEPSAMTRAFLLALVNPLHPDLDYLRAGSRVALLEKPHDRA